MLKDSSKIQHKIILRQITGLFQNSQVSLRNLDCLRSLLVQVCTNLTEQFKHHILKPTYPSMQDVLETKDAHETIEERMRNFMTIRNAAVHAGVTCF